MKIVVITGSPRKSGNSFAMTGAFIAEAESRGHEVKRFDAAMMKIGGCHACETCYKTGKPSGDLQKTAFRNTKGHLLPRKRPPFGLRKTAFCIYNYNHMFYLQSLTILPLKQSS